jgi:hypothetical protein
MQNFTTPSEPEVHLAAAAWSDPPLARVFWIDARGWPAELVSRDGGAWLRVSDEQDNSLPPIPAASAGGPIAVTAGTRYKERGDYEFVEVFYTAAEPAGAIINLVRKPALGSGVGDFGGAVIVPGDGDDKLTLADRLTVSMAILFGIASFITGVLTVRIGWTKPAQTLTGKRKDEEAGLSLRRTA